MKARDYHVAKIDARAGIRVAREIDKELSIARVLRMKRKPQQSLLAAGTNDGIRPRQIQKRCRQHETILDNSDPAGLLDDEQAAAVIARVRDINRCGEAAGDWGERDAAKS